METETVFAPPLLKQSAKDCIIPFSMCAETYRFIVNTCAHDGHFFWNGLVALTAGDVAVVKS